MWFIGKLLKLILVRQHLQRAEIFLKLISLFDSKPPFKHLLHNYINDENKHSSKQHGYNLQKKTYSPCIIQTYFTYLKKN